MQLSDIKQSKIILTGGAEISALRGELNSAYSTAPPELAKVFEAALDQVVDQQIKVNEALLRLITTEDLKEAEAAFGYAVREAQRAALRAARSYADHQSDRAKESATKLVLIPRDNTSLFADKRQLDAKFLNAIRLHEKDDIMAFPQLLEAVRMYGEWSTKVQEEAIVGSQGLIRSEKRRLRRASISIIIALVALVLTIINVIVTLSRK